MLPRLFAILAAAVLAFYLIAGAVWTALPYFTVTCPTGASSKGVVAFALDWLTWPGDALRVFTAVTNRELSYDEARMLSFCPRNQDTPIR